MTKDRNNTPSSPRSPRYSNNQERGSRAPRSNYRNYNNKNSSKKNYSKPGILLKSSVYSLGIVLVVLVVAFFIILQNKNNASIYKKEECQKKAIKINGKIEKIAISKSEIIAITTNKKGDQEIIKIEKNCLNEVSRNKFKR